MKCEICGEEAVYRFSPDLDIDGLGACETHKEKMEYAYFILLNEGLKPFQSYMKSLEKSETPPSEKPK
jgi:hypothetical protein